MSAALPVSEPCCLASCDDVLVQNIPGPAGATGAAGAAGAPGASSVTTLVDPLTMPAELAGDVVEVASTAGLAAGQIVYIEGLGYLSIISVIDPYVTFRNIENTATGAYPTNAAPGTIAPTGNLITIGGLQGPAGPFSGVAAGGQLKGTYPNPKLLIPNSLGALAVGNGTDAASLSAGTNGQLPAYDSTQPLGLLPKSLLPITGGTNVAADRVLRLSSATGTPIALAASKTSIKEPGAAGGVIVADASAGNARGIDAVDLQVNRPAVGATAVASGAQSVVVGGEDNIASAQRAVVVGGQRNSCSAVESFIGGGEGNTVDSTQSSVVGGDTNSISGGSANESFIGGGKSNALDTTQSVIVGGDSNTISGAAANESFIGGGNLNAITGSGQATIAGGAFNSVSAQYGSVLGGFTNGVSASYAVISGGSNNTVSGQYGSILGGASNTVTGVTAVIVGGVQALADKYGQRAFSAGRFAASGDCQQSDLVWRIQTTGIVGATEMFLDGNSLRATISAGRTVAFDILITARSSAGLNAAWTVKGIINNLAGTTSIATAVVTALIADNSGATFGTLANVPVVSADDPNDALVIKVVNPAATNVRWMAHGRLVEIGY